MTLSPALYCVATHHKGGTVWMKQVFRAFAKALDIPMIGMWSDRQLAENQFRNSQSLPIATGNFWVDVFAKGLVEGIDGHKRDKAFRQCQKTAGLSLTHTPKNNDLAGVKKPDGTLHPISLTPLGQRVKYNNANQDTQTPKAEKKAQAPLAVEVNLDQPMQIEVQSETPVEPARPAVATSTKNICPPGAPILYRGNMTCPDRF